MKTRVKEIILGTALVVGMFTMLAISGTSDYEVAKAEQEYREENPETTVHTFEDGSEQEYIVRYGTTKFYGEKITTEDGNVWWCPDPPELKDGTRVRVLFESNGTYDPSDDTIIDIVELDI